jgi:hypothetical protein
VAGAVAGAVLLAALLFSVGLTAATDQIADRSRTPTTSAVEVAPPPTVPATPPSTSVTPPTTVPDPEVQPTYVDVPELVAFVEQQRGLTFEEVPRVALFEEDQFQARARADYADALEQYRYQLVTLGVIGPDEDPGPFFDQLIGSLGGYYDFETGEVWIRGTGLDGGNRAVIVHELTHALDDQWFDLARADLAERMDEAQWTYQTLSEGSATVVGNTYTRQVLGLEPGAVGSDPLVNLLFGSYDLGEDFAEALLAAGGTAELDRAFREVPATSKEIMEPSRWFEGFVAAPVAPPPTDGELIDEGLFGQFSFSVMFGLVLDESSAFDLATRWAGDWSVTWIEDDETACTRVDAVTQAPEWRAQWYDVLVRWAEDVPQAEVELVGQEVVRVTTCGPIPPARSGAESPARPSRAFAGL